MTGTTISSGTLDPRRAKLLFRAWHRGIKEMDLIFGRFADAHLAKMHDSDLDEFEMMLETSDRDLLKWFTGEEPVPDAADTPLFRQIAEHANIVRLPI
jgi:antitoxin CptB